MIGSTLRRNVFASISDTAPTAPPACCSVASAECVLLSLLLFFLPELQVVLVLAPVVLVLVLVQPDAQKIPHAMM